MNREIKFRAWDGKEMQLAFDLSQNPKYWWEDNKDYPLMQYTGLKDKNGKEIYEGDIIKYKDWDVHAGHTRDWEQILEVEQDNWSWNTLSDISPDMETIEVIGNIYENPELLEKE